MYFLNKSSNPSSYAIDETIKREGKKRGSYVSAKLYSVPKKDD